MPGGNNGMCFLTFRIRLIKGINEKTFYAGSNGLVKCLTKI